jgi:hypothetical protein
LRRWSVQIPGRGLDTDLARVHAHDDGDRGCHLRQQRRQLGARGDDRHVEVHRTPAGGADLRRDRAQQDAAIDPDGSARIGREEPAQIAEAGRPEQRVGDRVQGHVSVRMAGQAGRAFDRQSAENERLARAEGVAVRAEPDTTRCRDRGGHVWAGAFGRHRICGHCRAARHRRPAGHEAAVEHRSGAFEIDWHRHLEVGRFATDRMDGDSTSLQQGGLIGPGFGAVGRVGGVGALQQAAPHALRSLSRRDVGSIDGRTNPIASQPLERLAHREHRDRGAVAGGRFRHRPNQRRADKRPGRVVDEDHGVGRLAAGPAANRAAGSHRGSLGRAALVCFFRRLGQGRHARSDGLLAPLPAGNDGHHRVRQPVGGRDRGDALRGRHDDDPIDACRRERLDRPAQDSSAFQLRLELVHAAHPAAGPCGHDDRFDRIRGPGLLASASAHSRCICAKTIRPMTVWRTRVTRTSSSASTKRAPPSITTIVPSSR